MPDAIDQFISMPKEERGKLFEQLAPEKQHKLLDEIKKRKDGSKPSAPHHYSQSEMDAAFVKRMKEHPPVPNPNARKYSRYSYGMEDVKPYASPILGGIGGIVGFSAGGPIGAVTGAGVGGTIGKHIERKSAGEPSSVLSDVVGGAEQAAYEATGQIGGRIVGRLAKPVIEKYPELFKLLGLSSKTEVSPRSVGHLTAAAATKAQAGPAKEAIAATIGDIEKEIKLLPPKQRNVEGFLDAVTRKRAALHEEYGNALGPHANEDAGTEPIVRQIMELKKPWMDVGKEGEAEKKAIEEAAIRFRMPRTVGQLDSLRQQLNSDLAAFYSKAPNARYAAENGNVNLAIDAAIARGARDVLYPIADRSVGKPAGYFADVLDREGNLIHLRGILQKRIQDLGGAQAISEVTPRLSSENISLSGHLGSAPRAGFYGIRSVIAPPRELTQAGKHVAKAYPSIINSLPYAVLFSNAVRVRGPIQRHLEELRDQQQNPTE